MEPLTVIVWAADDFNALGLLRQLGKANLNLFFLIIGKLGVTSKSIYCKMYAETATLMDGYEYLLENFRSCPTKPIILTSGDAIITFIDHHRKELDEYFILPGTKEQGLIEKYTDKNTMTQLAMEIGINCPQSRFVKWDSVVDDVIFPCVLKPAHEKPGHYNEFKSRKCDNLNSLKNTLRLVHKDSEFILQQFIQKEKETLVYGGRMRDGKTLLAGAFVKDRLLESGPGSHGVLTSEIPADIDTSMISAFLERIEYFGPFSFEYGLMGDKAYFFEVNLRNDGTSHYFYQAGANIPLAYVLSCVGMDYSCISTQVKGDNNWFIDEVYGVEDVLTGKVSLKQWNKEKTEATIFRYYSEEDIEPWRLAMKGRWITIIRNLIVSFFRIYIVCILDKLGIKK